jgi:predicted nucleotidyltransferase
VYQENIPLALQQLVEQLAAIPGVVAVTLGGSRARGESRPDSDWDFGLYYRGKINSDDVRSLGYTGYVAELGEWGRLVNGGGWLEIADQRVDVLYRDLNVAEYWVKEAQQGQFEVDNVAGHIVGLPTYVLMGEMALGRVLVGELERPSFPDALRTSAPPWWEGNAAFSLMYAEGYARRGEVTAFAGSLARATMAVAHARFVQRGMWALNEKRLAQRAGLEQVDEIIASVGKEPEELTQALENMRDMLGLARPQGLKADEVVRKERNV